MWKQVEKDMQANELENTKTRYAEANGIFEDLENKWRSPSIGLAALKEDLKSRTTAFKKIKSEWKGVKKSPTLVDQLRKWGVRLGEVEKAIANKKTRKNARFLLNYIGELSETVQSSLNTPEMGKLKEQTEYKKR